MKASAVKWMIAASALLFLLGGNAWADGKKDRNRQPRGEHYTAPRHHDGRGGTRGDYRPSQPHPYGRHEARRNAYRQPHPGHHPYDRRLHGPGPQVRPQAPYRHKGRVPGGYFFSTILRPPGFVMGFSTGHRW